MVNKIYKTKKVALLFRNNAAEFLNGLTANEITKPRNAFLNIHGRIIATFDQLKISDEEVWALVEAPFVDAVCDHLDRYAKLSGVKVEKRKEVVFFNLDGELKLIEGEYRIPQNQGQLVIADRHLQTNVSVEEFTFFRLKNYIPVHGIDYQDEFLLNINETDFVSFTKGCFLGQEPVSKVHSRSKPSWKLVVKYEDECTAEEKLKMTSRALDPQAQRYLGFVFVDNK